MNVSSACSALILLLNLFLFPFYLFLFLVAVGAILYRAPRRQMPEPPPRFLFVIPAHDEAVGIAATVRSCLGVDYPTDLFEVAVIADNCEDDTAGLAEAAGARVIVRSHPTDRSKGHALTYFFNTFLAGEPPAGPHAVVVVDADTSVDPAILNEFADALGRGHDWVQAFDTVSNVDDSWRTLLMTHAFSLINGVLLLGLSSAGLSASLRGNGMCLSTAGLRRFHWTTNSLAEDLEFSWSLRAAGERITFAPRGVVYARMPSGGGADAAIQRRRWEFGRRDVTRRMFLPILRSDRLGKLAKLASLAELCLPPMVVLLTAFVGSLFATIGLLISQQAAPPLAWSLVALNTVAALSLALYGLAPFYCFGLHKRVLLGLICLPFYTIWKLVTYLQGRPIRWVRTPRV